jgi:peroxiredoxin/outer membrane lipoprotein-sorting protein
MRASITTIALVLCFAFIARAENTPTTQPAEVKEILDSVSKAYIDAKSLSMTGKISLDFDAGGDQKHETSDFTASFAAPNQFRHEVKDDVLVVGTGEKIFAYLPGKNEYVSIAAPKDRAEAKDISEPITQLLRSQNPALLMTISKDPTLPLVDGAKNLYKADDVKLGDTSYTTLTFDKDDRGYRVLVDPKTNFIRQIRIDLKPEIVKRGMEDVKTADLTFDYIRLKSGEANAPEQYAWTPPRDATVAKEEVADDSAGAATALVGKPAPDFKLTGLDGKEIAMADLKGSVVVLDFWATWCGPCVASLPHIDKVHSELAEKGLKVFAVNLEEPKATVQKFIVSQKLTLPVLLDADGATGKKYMANAIPETVIIGKDGTVKKVFVGFGGDEALRAAIDAEMKQ